MRKLPCIALYAPSPGSGKSTIADILVEELGYRKVPLASTLKGMLRPFLNACVEAGYIRQDTILRRLYGDLKEEIIPELGVSTRHLAQTLGTEWGQHCVRPSVWSDMAKNKILKLQEEGRPCVVDDMRFHHEYRMLCEIPALRIKVLRPGLKPYSVTHSSEGGLDNAFFDQTIINDGTISDLREKVSIALSH